MNQRGFSIIEVLFSVAIISIISYAAVSAMRTQQIAVNTANRNLEFEAMAAEMNLYLTHPDTCVPFLKDMTIHLPNSVPGLPYTLSNTEALKLQSLKFRGSTLAEVGVEKNGILVEHAEFNQIIRNDIPPVGTTSRYLLNFNFLASKKGATFGAHTKKKDWTMYVEVDPAGKITKCTDSKTSEEAQCLLKRKTYDLSKYPVCQ